MKPSRYNEIDTIFNPFTNANGYVYKDILYDSFEEAKMYAEIDDLDMAFKDEPYKVSDMTEYMLQNSY